MLEGDTIAGQGERDATWIEWIDAQMGLSAPKTTAAPPVPEPTQSVAWAPPQGPPQQLLLAAQPRVAVRSSAKSWIGIAAIGVLVTVGGFLAIRSEASIQSPELRAAVVQTKALHTVAFETVLDSVGTSRTTSGTADLTNQLVRFDSAIAPSSAGGQVAPSAFLDLRTKALFVNTADSPQSQARWAKIDLGSDAGSLGTLVQSLGDGMDRNPLAAVDLVDASSKWKKLGDEMIFNRVMATHFVIEVPTPRALAVAGTSVEELSESTTTLPSTVTFHVWVDSDHVIRQVEFEIPGQDQVVHYAARYLHADPVPAVMMPAEIERDSSNLTR